MRLPGAMLMDRCKVGRILLTTTASIIGGAGVLKFVDLSEFSASLTTWDLIPRSLHPVMALTVPSVEVFAAGMVSVSGFAARWSWALVVLLALFTAAFIAHWAFASPPSCGCFGRMMRFESATSEAQVVIVRNIALMGATIVGIVLTRSRSPRVENPDDSPTRTPVGARAFTLIETILVVAMIGILVSLLLPSLGGAKRQATRLGTLSELRQHVGVIATYQNDHREAFPYPNEPTATYTVHHHPTFGWLSLLYFEGYDTWHWPMIDSYYTTWNASLFSVRPANDGFRGIFTDYWYPSVFRAHPEFWNPSTRTGPAQWRQTYAADVVFPSAKCLLFNARPIDPPDYDYGTSRVEIGMTDGSADAYERKRFASPYPKGEGEWWGAANGYGIRLMHTIDGLRARDIIEVP
jgi:type II secretory pathway pseudopilin PulG